MPGAQPINVREVFLIERGKVFPDEVIESFNQLIRRNFVKGKAVVSRDEVVKLIVQKGLDRNQIYERGWLDIERVYRAAEWSVSRDPSSPEDYVFEPEIKFIFGLTLKQGAIVAAVILIFMLLTYLLR